LRGFSLPPAMLDTVPGKVNGTLTARLGFRLGYEGGCTILSEVLAWDRWVCCDGLGKNLAGDLRKLESGRPQQNSRRGYDSREVDNRQISIKG
jgi:hypothetical protein